MKLWTFKTDGKHWGLHWCGRPWTCRGTTQKCVCVCFCFCFCKFSSPDWQAERVRSCSPTVEISRVGVMELEKVRELEIWLKSIEDVPSPQSQIWWGETKVIFFKKLLNSYDHRVLCHPSFCYKMRRVIGEAQYYSVSTAVAWYQIFKQNQKNHRWNLTIPRNHEEVLLLSHHPLTSHHF